MGKIRETVDAFFSEDDWPTQELDEATIRTGFSGKNGKYTCYGRCREAEEQFAFYAISPMNVPEEHRAAIAEFITRANYGMIVGNFEMDFSDGEIRYKASVDVEGSSLDTAMVKQMVYAAVYMMDKYVPGVMKVVYAGVSPQDAIAEIEA